MRNLKYQLTTSCISVTVSGRKLSAMILTCCNTTNTLYQFLCVFLLAAVSNPLGHRLARTGAHSVLIRRESSRAGAGGASAFVHPCHVIRGASLPALSGLRVSSRILSGARSDRRRMPPDPRDAQLRPR